MIFSKLTELTIPYLQSFFSLKKNSNRYETLKTMFFQNAIPTQVCPFKVQIYRFQTPF